MHGCAGAGCAAAKGGDAGGGRCPSAKQPACMPRAPGLQQLHVHPDVGAMSQGSLCHRVCAARTLMPLDCDALGGSAQAMQLWEALWADACWQRLTPSTHKVRCCYQVLATGFLGQARVCAEAARSPECTTTIVVGMPHVLQLCGRVAVIARRARVSAFPAGRLAGRGCAWQGGRAARPLPLLCGGRRAAPAPARHSRVPEPGRHNADVQHGASPPALAAHGSAGCMRPLVPTKLHEGALCDH